MKIAIIFFVALLISDFAACQQLPEYYYRQYSHPDTVSKYGIQQVLLKDSDTLYFVTFNERGQSVKVIDGKKRVVYSYHPNGKKASHQLWFEGLNDSLCRTYNKLGGMKYYFEKNTQSNQIIEIDYYDNGYLAEEKIRLLSGELLHQEKRNQLNKISFQESRNPVNQEVSTLNQDWDGRQLLFSETVILNRKGDTIAYDKSARIGDKLIHLRKWDLRTGEELKNEYIDPDNYQFFHLKDGNLERRIRKDGAMERVERFYKDGSGVLTVWRTQKTLRCRQKWWFSEGRELTEYSKFCFSPTTGNDFYDEYFVADNGDETYELVYYDSTDGRALKQLFFDEDSVLTKTYKHVYRSGVLKKTRVRRTGAKNYINRYDGQNQEFDQSSIWKSRGPSFVKTLERIPIDEPDAVITVEVFDYVERETMVWNGSKWNRSLSDYLQLMFREIEEQLVFPDLLKEMGYQGDHYLKINFVKGVVDSVEHLRTLDSSWTTAIDDYFDDHWKGIQLFPSENSAFLEVVTQSGRFKKKVDVLGLEEMVLRIRLVLEY